MKKAVATIKSEGPDKAYAEIDDPEGPFADPGGTTETGNFRKRYSILQALFKYRECTKEAVNKRRPERNSLRPKKSCGFVRGHGGLAATAGDNRR